MSSTVALLRLGKKPGKAAFGGGRRGGFKARTINLGEYFGRWFPTTPPPRLTVPLKLKVDVALRLVDSQKPRLVPRKTAARRYRAALKGSDELFSTATTLDFMEGILKTPGFTNALVQRVSPWMDILSSLRIPTEDSGFATLTEIMQHPANRQKAQFADPYKTAATHSKMDTARVDYILRAMERAQANNASGDQVLLAGGRAAIEFTLNHFTAPITASNVKSLSLRAKNPVSDRELMDQVANRELMKTTYEELGGTLRAPIVGETAHEAITRKWKFGMPLATKNDPYPEAPPSPRR